MVGVLLLLLRVHPRKLDKVLDNILSILRLVEIKQERDIEDKESEEELYYESEKSI